MFGFRWPELVVVVVIGLLFFGPKRLPEIGASVGKTIKEFQRSMREITEPHDAPAVTHPAQTQQIPAAPVAQVASVTPAEPAVIAESPVFTEPPARAIERTTD